MQLNLGFLKTPRPGPNVWEALQDEQRLVVLDVLARLIVQAAPPNPAAEVDDE